MKRVCARCGRHATNEWSICADKNRKRFICDRCDVELNTMVMRWAFGSSREKAIERYREMKLG